MLFYWHNNFFVNQKWCFMSIFLLTTEYIVHILLVYNKKVIVTRFIHTYSWTSCAGQFYPWKWIWIMLWQWKQPCWKSNYNIQSNFNVFYNLWLFTFTIPKMTQVNLAEYRNYQRFNKHWEKIYDKWFDKWFI
jgi:hypothetical protein